MVANLSTPVWYKRVLALLPPCIFNNGCQDWSKNWYAPGPSPPSDLNINPPDPFSLINEVLPSTTESPLESTWSSRLLVWDISKSAPLPKVSSDSSSNLNLLWDLSQKTDVTPTVLPTKSTSPPVNVVTPVNIELPKTSNNTIGWVLPIPTEPAAPTTFGSTHTKLDAPSTSPVSSWYWTLLIYPPAPDCTVLGSFHSSVPSLAFTIKSPAVPGSLSPS